jgi:hypothetical protein
VVEVQVVVVVGTVVGVTPAGNTDAVVGSDGDEVVAIVRGEVVEVEVVVVMLVVGGVVTAGKTDAVRESVEVGVIDMLRVADLEEVLVGSDVGVRVDELVEDKSRGWVVARGVEVLLGVFGVSVEDNAGELTALQAKLTRALVPTEDAQLWIIFFKSSFVLLPRFFRPNRSSWS